MLNLFSMKRNQFRLYSIRQNNSRRVTIIIRNDTRRLDTIFGLFDERGIKEHRIIPRRERKTGSNVEKPPKGGYRRTGWN